MTKLTAGQRKFLEAIAEDAHVVVHRRVAAPLFDAGLIFPRPGNIFFWLVGCNSDCSSEFVLTEAGAERCITELGLSVACPLPAAA